MTAIIKRLSGSGLRARFGLFRPVQIGDYVWRGR